MGVVRSPWYSEVYHVSMLGSETEKKGRKKMGFDICYVASDTEKKKRENNRVVWLIRFVGISRGYLAV